MLDGPGLGTWYRVHVAVGSSSDCVTRAYVPLLQDRNVHLNAYLRQSCFVSLDRSEPRTSIQGARESRRLLPLHYHAPLKLGDKVTINRYR